MAHHLKESYYVPTLYNNLVKKPAALSDTHSGAPVRGWWLGEILCHQRIATCAEEVTKRARCWNSHKKVFCGWIWLLDISEVVFCMQETLSIWLRLHTWHFAFNPATLFSIVSWTFGFQRADSKWGERNIWDTPEVPCSSVLLTHTHTGNWVMVMWQEECQTDKENDERVSHKHTCRRGRCIAYILYITRLDK